MGEDWQKFSKRNFEIKIFHHFPKGYKGLSKACLCDIWMESLVHKDYSNGSCGFNYVKHLQVQNFMWDYELCPNSQPTFCRMGSHTMHMYSIPRSVLSSLSIPFPYQYCWQLWLVSILEWENQKNRFFTSIPFCNGWPSACGLLQPLVRTYDVYSVLHCHAIPTLTGKARICN